MKFSYLLLKKLVPAIKSPQEVAELLTMGLFEVEEVADGAIEVKVLPNRYSDAASHWGLAREIAALYRVRFQEPKVKPMRTAIEKRVPVSVETKVCRRMMARYFEDVKIAPSPLWMWKVLISCGLRPINNLVDITNYAMLETGQPLHAFDFTKMRGGRLEVRDGRDGETVELLDGTKVYLDSDVAALADAEEALDVAGVKGGKRAEITDETREILLTAGNFDGVAIYKASRKTDVRTDASVRFSHCLAPELAEVGIRRAAELIQELCGGKAGALVDVYPKKAPRRVVIFDIERVNKLLGTEISKTQALALLRLLGFSVRGNMVMAPVLRTDVTTLEDVAEEIGRLYGYDRILPVAPRIALVPAMEEPKIVFKKRVRDLMLGFGFDEVYNISFADRGLIEIANPIASDKNCLRSSLFPLLLKNVDDNFRFFDEVRIFEIGNVFGAAGKVVKDTPDLETLTLGVAFGAKSADTFFELKGALEGLLSRLGADVEFRPRTGSTSSLWAGSADAEIFVSGKEVGYISRVQGDVSIAEIHLDALMPLVSEETRFKPLPKYPAVERDISLLIPVGSRVGEIMKAMRDLDKKIIRAIRLIDEYASPEWKGIRSVTFRIVLRRDDRTLTSEEADRAMSKVSVLARERFGAEIR